MEARLHVGHISYRISNHIDYIDYVEHMHPHSFYTVSTHTSSFLNTDIVLMHRCMHLIISKLLLCVHGGWVEVGDWRSRSGY